MELEEYDDLSELTDWKIARKLVNLHKSAAQRNIDFELSFNKLKSLMNQKKCYFTKVPFGVKGTDLAMSIDRIDNNIGYIDSNVAACTVRINSKKNNLTFEDIKILYNKMNQHNIKLKKKQKF